ncbi:MAG: hypothetical protein IPG45_11835 [Deltaproteobacteria bacterium]|jgi:hypothetical protein|nr:hypothetical protein [Deltaproteobacteria bacterium]
MWRLGPIALEGWHLILLALGLLLLGWVLRGFMIRISGTWERVDEGVPEGKRELITLVQFGPFVRGRRLMRGGFQEYTGILRGRTIFISRRDHGEELIISQGFPKELVPDLDGSVTARLRLTLSADGRAIFGTFVPQKIEFTYKPPAVTRRVFLEPSFRRYKLVSRDIIDLEAEAEQVAQTEKTPFRKTI